MNLSLKNKSKNFLKEIRSIFFAIAVSALLTSIFIILSGANPLEAFAALIKGVVTRRYGIGETLVKATPLLIVALGLSITFKAGLTNLGGDGQITMGAISSMLVATTITGLPTFIHMLLMALAAILAGAIWGGIAGFFRGRFNTNETIMTLMMNYIAMYFMLYLVEGPLQDPTGLLPQSRMIPDSLKLTKILKGTRAHTGIFVALVIAIIVYLFLNKTVYGYKIRAVGHSRMAAGYAGINAANQSLLSLSIAGGLSGLAGMLLLSGIFFRVQAGIATGVGFTAIVVAIMGKLNAVGIVLAAVFIAALGAGGNSMQAHVGVQESIVGVFQGFLIFFLIITHSSESSIYKRFTSKLKRIKINE